MLLTLHSVNIVVLVTFVVFLHCNLVCLEWHQGLDPTPLAYYTSALLPKCPPALLNTLLY